jgi:hypothetical protein
MEFTRYLEPTVIDNELMHTLATYMDDEIREELHSALAPCTNEVFLAAYCLRDKKFVELLYTEFSIALWME